MFVDLSKSVDTVHHAILLKQVVLNRRELCSWLNDYVSDRTQAIVIDSPHFLRYISCCAGVDTRTCSFHCSYKCYWSICKKNTDDTIMYTTAPAAFLAVIRLQSNFADVQEALTDIKLNTCCFQVVSDGLHLLMGWFYNLTIPWYIQSSCLCRTFRESTCIIAHPTHSGASLYHIWHCP